MFPFLPILGSVLGGLFSSSAAGKAADAQTTAAQNDLALQREQFGLIQQNLAPYLQGGEAANAAVMFELGLGPKPQNYEGFQATPGYDFRMQQGSDAIEASAAARGGLNSGATMQALQEQGQNFGSAEYGNYFAKLAGVAGQGLGAATMQGNAGQNYANAGSNAFGAMGNAQSAGFIGKSNAINDTVQDLTSIWGYQKGLNGLKPPTTSGAGGTSFMPWG